MVVNIGISPSDYWALTGVQRGELVAEFNRTHRKRPGKKK